MNSKELFPLADAPQAVLVKELKNRGLKIASAESLTGGMVSEYITKVSGASEVFECGICSYTCTSKIPVTDYVRKAKMIAKL